MRRCSLATIAWIACGVALGFVVVGALSGCTVPVTLNARIETPEDAPFPSIPLPPVLAVTVLPTKLSEHGGGEVIGDSIALGTGRALHARTAAREGVSSCWIAEHTVEFGGQWAVISAGINDPPGACIDDIRAKVHAPRVVWILPAAINSARSNVERAARERGDRTIAYECAGPCSATNFHPASYARLAADVARVLRNEDASR